MKWKWNYSLGKRNIDLLLTFKQLESHGCIISTVATNALVLKHQGISTHSTDSVFIVLNQFHAKRLTLQCTILETKIVFWRKWSSCSRVNKGHKVVPMIENIPMGWCKKDVTPLLTHWSDVFLALTHRYDGQMGRQTDNQAHMNVLIMNGSHHIHNKTYKLLSVVEYGNQ